MLKMEGGTIKIFRKERIMTLKQLVDMLQCNQRTVQRRLKEWHTYTSYNQNGRYYTLPDIARFDQYGLWRYKGIFFSKHGTLKQTIIVLVNNSTAGLTIAEAGRIVGVSLSSFMAQPRNVAQLRREKIDNIFVYFSFDEAIFHKQKENRIENNEQAKLTKLSIDTEAIVILVERIKYPHLSIDQLSMRLSKKGYCINSKVIRNLFEDQGILKKTPNMQ